MGTSYYLHQNVCKSCHRPEKVIYLGKKSAGWCFALATHSDLGITSLEDWKWLWNLPDAEIQDEYGRIITKDFMESLINTNEPKGGFKI